MLSNTVFCDETKERLDEKTKFRMHLRNRFFFSILVLLGGIFLSEQDARY